MDIPSGLWRLDLTKTILFEPSKAALSIFGMLPQSLQNIILK